jgi:arginine repressor
MTQAQSLVEDLLSRSPEKIRNSCGLTRLRERMSEEEAEALDRAIELIRLDTNSGKAKVYSCEWLTGVLNRHGHTISASTISRHLSKRCSCE